MACRLKPGELDAHGEIALALAQATMQQAIDASGLDKSTVAMRFCDSPRRRWAAGHLTRLLSGDCDLTVRDMGKLLAICGVEPRFERIPIGQPASTKPDADKVLSDRRVQAALKKHMEIQADFDDFDGDRRGIAAHLWDVEVEIVESVCRALQDFDGDRRGISQHLWNAKVEIVKSVSHALQPCPSIQKRRRRYNTVDQALNLIFATTPKCPNCHQDPYTRHIHGPRLPTSFEIICLSPHCTFRPPTLDPTEEGAKSRWFEARNAKLAERTLKRMKP